MLRLCRDRNRACADLVAVVSHFVGLAGAASGRG
jgi:hypothetical protein